MILQQGRIVAFLSYHSKNKGIEDGFHALPDAAALRSQ